MKLLIVLLIGNLLLIGCVNSPTTKQINSVCDFSFSNINDNVIDSSDDNSFRFEKNGLGAYFYYSSQIFCLYEDKLIEHRYCEVVWDKLENYEHYRLKHNNCNDWAEDSGVRAMVNA